MFKYAEVVEFNITKWPISHTAVYIKILLVESRISPFIWIIKLFASWRKYNQAFYRSKILFTAVPICRTVLGTESLLNNYLLEKLKNKCNYHWPFKKIKDISVHFSFVWLCLLNSNEYLKKIPFKYRLFSQID